MTIALLIQQELQRSQLSLVQHGRLRIAQLEWNRLQRSERDGHRRLHFNY